MAPTSTTVDWCSLPTEIMEIIADRLISLADRSRIRAVCKCWQSITPTARPNTPPFFYIVPRNRILCLIENRKYYLPHMKTKYDCQPFGSAHGRLGLVDSERVFLFDPLSGDRFDLPPLWTLPDVKTVSFDRTNVKTVVPTDVDYDRGRHASEGPYLVSLPTGELLLLLILIENPREIWRLQFVLRKLVGKGRDGSAWERVERLDDGWTIFVDATGSWAQPAGDAVGYKGSCIYFSISHEFKWKGKMCRSVYNGICDMAEKNIQPMCCSSPRKHDQPAAGIWLETKYEQ